MPRRNQYKKKPKRHRRGSYDRDGHTENEANDVHFFQATSLEEDLRQQRIRQQERQRAKNEEKRRNGHEFVRDNENCDSDIGFEQCQKLDTGGPVASVRSKTNHYILKGRVSPSSIVPVRVESTNGSNIEPSNSSASPFSIRLPPAFMLRHIEETSPQLSMWKRVTLRKLWQPQHQYETLSVQPRAASLFCKTKWPQYTLEYNSNLRCSWDLSCKHRLHPSARTFDVATLVNNRSNKSSPTIATMFQDGWGLLRKESQNAINSIKAPPLYSIRMHTASATCGMIVRPGNSNNGSKSSPYSFRWYPLPHASSYVEAELPRPVTDFCFGKEIALFACPRYSASESLNPLFLPLEQVGGIETPTYYNGAVRSINVRNFPQSDALRIEMMCEGQEKLLGFGHRNGQASILDLRANGTVCTILQCEESSSSSGRTTGRSLGSVSDLGFLVNGSKTQVLVKRSFGSCQLHDLRKSTSASSSVSHNSTTVVHHMTVPSNAIHPSLTANCNGFFVDPNGHQTLFSPYIDKESGDARLGVWSLQTGLMVGSRLLQRNGSPNGGSRSTLYVELCSKASPLVISKHDPPDPRSTYGVWLKCGAFTNERLTSKVGSLHQLAIPGRWKCD